MFQFQLVGDAGFNVGLDKTVEYHEKYGKTPVYAYSFEFRGTRNPLAKVNVYLESLGKNKLKFLLDC